MRALELKVPPPLVALAMILSMWGLAQFPPYLEMQPIVRYLLAAAPAILGLIFAVSGFIAFRKAKTTINPMKPDKATALVSTGIYAITRNPMYVGLLFLLLAWNIYLTSLWAILGPVIFFLWINYLQIIPEERFLTRLFGDEFIRYQSKVRRWL